jgi:hypothetical protein
MAVDDTPRAAPGPPAGSHYVARRPATGHLVALMDGGVEQRGFQLVGYPTRGLRAGELHELIVTDQPDLGTDARIDRVAYQGFVEIAQAGVAVRGDRLVIGGREVGILVGFDECHMPNHLNIIVYSTDWRGGRSRGLALGDLVAFEPPATA